MSVICQYKGERVILIYEDKELTKVGANIAKVLAKVSDIKK